MIAFLKNFLFVQNLASWVLSKIPPMVEHNVQKYAALRKAFYLTAIDGVQGDYLEFGVFTGSSLIAAARIHKKQLALTTGETRFLGFDSFKGFGKIASHDSHPFYQDSTFAVNAKKIINNIKNKTRGLDVSVYEGYFSETLNEKTRLKTQLKKARVILIDCDLKDASRLALDWTASALQPGTVIILDDYFSYKGAGDKGVAGAFAEFGEANPHLQFRRLFDYGYGGVAMIVSEVGSASARRLPAKRRKAA